MGLFSGLMGKGVDRPLDVSTAVMIPIVAAMLADGEIDRSEIGQIRTICLMSPLYAKNTSDEDTEIIMRSLKLVKDQGAQMMCEKAREALSPALRETALAFAIRMVFSDNHIAKGEEELIERLVSWLGVAEDRARMFLETVAVMQRDAKA